MTKTYANDIKVNGDPCCCSDVSPIVNTSSATSKSPATTLANAEEMFGENEASHLPSVKGIRLRTVSTPIEYNFSSSFNSNSNNSNSNSNSVVGVKVPSRRNNSLVPSASNKDDLENIQIHSQQWLAKTQSFLRSLSQQQTKSHRGKEAVHKTFSNDSTHIRRCKLIACEEVSTQDKTNGHQNNVTSSLTPPPRPPPSPPSLCSTSLLASQPPVMSSHHSSSSEDGEWYAQLELLSEQVITNQDNFDLSHPVTTTITATNDELKSTHSNDEIARVNVTSGDAGHENSTDAVAAGIDDGVDATADAKDAGDDHFGNTGGDDGGNALKATPDATGTSCDEQLNSVIPGLSPQVTEQKSLTLLAACNTADSGGSMTELTTARRQESPREQTPVTHQDLLFNNETAAIEVESVGLKSKLTSPGATCCSDHLNTNDDDGGGGDDDLPNEKMNCINNCQMEDVSESAKNRRKLCPGCTVV